MSSNSPFVLSRATPSDMESLVELQYDCFSEFVRKFVMGCSSKHDLPKLTESYAKEMQNDPNDVWIKVVDKESGHIIAGSNWKLYVNGPTSGGKKEEAPEWLEGEMREKSIKTMAMINEVRGRSMPGPFIYLHICFTHADFRRRGAGGMMLRWGCDVADLLGLPGWIEASEEGNYLYKAFGFYDFEKVEAEIPVVNMKRDAPKSAFEGGKVKPGINGTS